MDINQKDRNQLRAYFTAGAIPSQQEFGELIRAMLNQKDDGVFKEAGNPLAIEAAGDTASEKHVLRFYDSFGDEAPAWTLSLSPRGDAADPASARRGLGLADAGGVIRLFIDHASGRVGLGTLAPASTLHVSGDVTITGHIKQEPWHLAELNAPWVDYVAGQNPAAFFKDTLGMVHLRGFVKGGPARSTVFVLPEGYRPQARTWLSTATYPGVAGRIDVLPDGRVVAQDANPPWLAMDGLSFRPD